ncbi:DUF1428 domain-containing protein [Hyphomonas sp.]|uniref:DUF1428 domain-containing protein n=1 Tax=Hyphomonas sp. TaxID=87 RepID=UPI0025BF047F|nr:DUF1428 domain-containing protein [Hyphomonas sp.]
MAPSSALPVLARTAEHQLVFAGTTIQSARACRLSEALLFTIEAVRRGLSCPVFARRRACRHQQAAAKQIAEQFIAYGTASVVDAWSDDVPEGKVNSFHTAVLKKPGEDTGFSWLIWKDQAAHDANWEKIMADPRMAAYSPASVGGG